MARPRKTSNLEEDIRKQEEAVSKTKTAYDAAVKKLKDLYAKRDEAKKQQLFDAIEKSDKSYEEIMAYVTGTAKN